MHMANVLPAASLSFTFDSRGSEATHRSHNHDEKWCRSLPRSGQVLDGIQTAVIYGLGGRPRPGKSLQAISEEQIYFLLGFMCLLECTEELRGPLGQGVSASQTTCKPTSSCSLEECFISINVYISFLQGAQKQGISTHVRVKRKADASGIGAVRFFIFPGLQTIAWKHRLLVTCHSHDLTALNCFERGSMPTITHRHLTEAS